MRRFCLTLFGLLPAMLLVARAGAELLVAVIGLAYLAVAVRRRSGWTLTGPMPAVLLGTWLVLNLVVSADALDRASSLRESLPWVRFVLLFLAVNDWLVRSRADLARVAWLWAVTLGLALLDGYVQWLTGTSLSGQPMFGDRLTGPLSRPNIGMFMLRIGYPLLGAALLLSDRGASLARTAMIVFATVAAVLFVQLTGERAASVLSLLALATTLTLAFVVVPERRRLAAALWLLFAAVTSTVLLTNPRIAHRATLLAADLGSYWQTPYGELVTAGLRMWWRYPVTGVGLDNFERACHLLTESSMRYGCYPHPHNPYIEWLAESGVVGTAGYLFFLVLVIRRVSSLLHAASRAHAAGAVLIGALVTLLFPFTASQSIFSNWPAMVFWCALAMTVACAGLAAREAQAAVDGA